MPARHERDGGRPWPLRSAEEAIDGSPLRGGDEHQDERRVDPAHPERRRDQPHDRDRPGEPPSNAWWSTRHGRDQVLEDRVAVERAEREEVQQAQADGHEEGVVDQSSDHRVERSCGDEQKDDQTGGEAGERSGRGNGDHAARTRIDARGVAAAAVKRDRWSVAVRHEGRGMATFMEQHARRRDDHPGQHRLERQMEGQPDHGDQQQEAGADLHGDAERSEGEGWHGPWPARLGGGGPVARRSTTSTLGTP